MKWKYKKGDTVVIDLDGTTVIAVIHRPVVLKEKPRYEEELGYLVVFEGETVGNWIYETDVKGVVNVS